MPMESVQQSLFPVLGRFHTLLRTFTVFVSVIVLLMTGTPARADKNASVLRIESDDIRVMRQGDWQTLESPSASAGSYLINTSPNAGLSLMFSDTYIEIVYVAGPGLGTLAIEVDNTLIRTVNTAAPSLSFNQSTSVNYLSGGIHTLRVYAVEGIIAIDAFGALQFGSTPTPTLFDSGTPAFLPQDGQGLFYYFQGQTIPLTVSEDFVAVQFTTNNTQEQAQVVTAAASVLTTQGAISLQQTDNTVLYPVQNDSAEAIRVVNELRAADIPQIGNAYPVFNAPNDAGYMVLGDEFIVRFAPNLTIQDINSFNAPYGVEIMRALPAQANTYLLRVTNPGLGDALQMANRYHQSQWVVFAEPNFTVLLERTHIPDDDLFGDQWHLSNNAQYAGAVVDADIDAVEAWDITQGNANITIAVLDDGVQIDHPDLADKIVSPYDVFSFPYDENPTPFPWDGHGTAVAGIIAARTNNITGIAGVCPLCSIMPIRIFADSDNDGILEGNYFDIAAAIDYAWQNGADILSNSWNSGASSIITDAIQRAVTQGRAGKGALVVVATGNNYGAVGFPATLDTVIAVGASNWCDQVKKPEDNLCNGNEFWWGSNFGNEVDLVAPGHSIQTTDITGGNGYTGGDYVSFNGTSSAAPIVSGGIGLLLSFDNSLTADRVKQFIYTTADDIGAVDYDIYAGWGRLNVHQALLAIDFFQTEVSSVPVDIISSVEITPSGGTQSQFSAQVEGVLRNSCITVDISEQEVQGNTISVELLALTPTNVMCGQALKNFAVSFPLNTTGLAPGDYTLIVNGSSTVFTIP